MELVLLTFVSYIHRSLLLKCEKPRLYYSAVAWPPFLWLPTVKIFILGIRGYRTDPC